MELKTFRDIVERNETFHGNELALIYEDRRLTYREYARRARKLANAMHGLGVRRQDRVSILAMNCPEYIDVYGISEVSAVIVSPINFRLAAPEIAYILNDVAPKVLFFESQYTEIVAGLREMVKVDHYICIGDGAPEWAHRYDDVIEAGADTWPKLLPMPEEITTILYTSGTTGRPKGVMSSHRGYLMLAQIQAVGLACDVGSKQLLMMPWFHLGARSQQSAQNVAGGTVVMHRALDPLEVVRTIEREGITHIHLAPIMLQMVMDVPGFNDHDLSSIKCILHSAAPMPMTLLRRALEKFGPVLVDGYGQTEGGATNLKKHFHKVEGTPEELKKLASVGQPNLDTFIRIVDDDDNEIPTGSIGEICFKSPQNMVGYWNNSIATMETLRGGWLHTGDVGYVDAEGFLYLVDRKKDMIISGGENIYSREVEEALMSHGSLAEVAIIGIPDAKWGESVKAVAIRKPGSAVTEDELIEHCRTMIARYKCPKTLDFVNELPRVPSGKINKVALRSLYKPKQS